MKICSKCSGLQPLTSFHADRRTPDGRVNECKVCRHTYRVGHYAANRERMLACQAKYIVDFPEKKAAANAKWHAANPAKRAANNARYRARKLRATPAWIDHGAVESIYDTAQRRTKETGVQWQVDHFYPLESDWVCGLHVEHNLQIISAVSNSMKGNRRGPQHD